MQSLSISPNLNPPSRERPSTGCLVNITLGPKTFKVSFAALLRKSAFLLAGTIGLILIFQTSKALWQWIKGNRFLSDIGPSGDLLIVLGTCSLPLWAPIAGTIQSALGVILVNPDPNDPRVIAGEIIRSNAETGAPVGGSLYIAAFIFLVLLILSVAIGLLWDRKRWPILAGSFAFIWLILFTSFFTN